MSYPTGAPGGYPGQSTQQNAPVFGRPPQRPNPLGNLSKATLLYLVTTALALVAYFCSFSSSAGGLNIQVMILLAGGLLAVLDLLPKVPDTLAFSTLLSSVGGLAVLASVIEASGGTVPGIQYVILVFAVLQFGVSVVALLMDHEVIKMAPRQAVPFQPGPNPSTTGSFPQTGQGPAQGHPGQPGPQGAPGQPPQPTQFMHQQGQQSPPQPQSTQFMQQPGQLSQPGTPPGGFGNNQQQG
jgi:hypothetical protein